MRGATVAAARAVRRVGGGGGARVNIPPQQASVGWKATPRGNLRHSGPRLLTYLILTREVCFNIFSEVGNSYGSPGSSLLFASTLKPELSMGIISKRRSFVCSDVVCCILFFKLQSKVSIPSHFIGI